MNYELCTMNYELCIMNYKLAFAVTIHALPGMG